MQYTIQVKAPDDGPAPHGRDWIDSNHVFNWRYDAIDYAQLLANISRVQIRVVEIT